MKIAVAGTGYVGLSIATLLAQRNEVVAVDVVPEKVEKINKKISPIRTADCTEPGCNPGWQSGLQRCRLCGHCCADEL